MGWCRRGLLHADRRTLRGEDKECEERKRLRSEDIVSIAGAIQDLLRRRGVGHVVRVLRVSGRFPAGGRVESLLAPACAPLGVALAHTLAKKANEFGLTAFVAFVASVCYTTKSLFDEVVGGNALRPANDMDSRGTGAALHDVRIQGPQELEQLRMTLSNAGATAPLLFRRGHG